MNVTPRPLSAAVLLLGVVALSAPVAAAPMPAAPSAILAAPASLAIHRSAIGDPPPGSRRRGRRPAGKDKPYQPLAKDPQAESSAAHKEYLKRYGF